MTTPLEPICWGIAGVGPKSKEFVKAINSNTNNGENYICALAASNTTEATTFAKEAKLIPSPDNTCEEDTDQDISDNDASKKEIDPPKLYGSFKDLAQDKKVTVVYVNSPENNRVKILQMMLNNGKHVLVEPPMVSDLTEAPDLVKLALEKKLLLLEAIWIRFLPHDKTTSANHKEDSEQTAMLAGTKCYSAFQQNFDEDTTCEVPEKRMSTMAYIRDCVRLVFSTFEGGKPNKIFVKSLGSPDSNMSNLNVILNFPEGHSASFVVDVSPGTLQFDPPSYCSSIVSFQSRGEVIKVHELSSLDYHAVDKTILIDEVRQCLNEDQIEFEMILSKFSLLIMEMAEAVAKELEIKELARAEEKKQQEKTAGDKS